MKAFRFSDHSSKAPPICVFFFHSGKHHLFLILFVEIGQFFLLWNYQRTTLKNLQTLNQNKVSASFNISLLLQILGDLYPGMRLKNECHFLAKTSSPCKRNALGKQKIMKCFLISQRFCSFLPEDIYRSVCFFWRYSVLFHALVHPFNLVLLSLAVISLILEDFRTAVVMGVMVCLSTTLRFIQEWKSEVAAEALKDLVKNRATVIRLGLPPESYKGPLLISKKRTQPRT